ncbi:hypothetical protein TNCV_2545091 [Trichonephila clavipes]|nr:hypothetical protein TNCV_2545091 [Trichonephila clavipes]
MDEPRTSSYYYKTDELLRCFNKITTLRTSSLDVPPCTMGRTPTRFKQHRVTTRPMNCYAVSTRLRRSRHFFLSLPSGRGQPFVNQESVNQESVKCLLKGRRVFWN